MNQGLKMQKRGVENDEKQGSGSGSGVDKDQDQVQVQVQVQVQECVKKQRAGSGSGVNEDKQEENQEKPSLFGLRTRVYYDPSSPRHSHLHSIRMDQLVCYANLAIALYNIKELTNFAQVKVLKVSLTFTGLVDFHITFQAVSPLGVASVFTTKVRQVAGGYPKIKIFYVRIKHADSDNGKNTQQDLSPDIDEEKVIPQVIKTLSAESLNNLAPSLSQLALIMYNMFKLRARKDAKHDIFSLKVVEAMKHAVKDTTYLVSFEAPLRDNSEILETFKTQIYMPTLFPTTTILNKKVRRIKHD